ncbi:MAG: hypothetical protein QM726_20035 [Chitinophagaceae bacterium]
MIIEDLASEEKSLHSEMREIYLQAATQKSLTRLEEIHATYRSIHQKYAALSHQELEALKRGLFLQWYSVSEPHWLTGISDLNETAKQKIIESLVNLITNERHDSEIVWMLNYYFAINEFALSGLREAQAVNKLIVKQHNYVFPQTINRTKMEERGQMGIYWNSLKRFNQD